MIILFGLIIISLLVATGFLFAFLWAVKNGQFEDDYTPSVRMLFDDETPVEPSTHIEKSSENIVHPGNQIQHTDKLNKNT
jgi:cbb3-type cytochrome oxidase maturation protein